MDEKVSRRRKILKGAQELFYKKGFSRVSMDELASHLGMSKKTLYNHFSSKEELLHFILQGIRQELASGVDRILLDDEMSFPEKLREVFSLVASRLSVLSAEFLSDLKKTSPQIWQSVEEYRTEAAFMRFNRLLDEGVRKGYIKKSINRTLAVMLYASAIETILNPEFVRLVPEDMIGEIPEKPAAVFDGLIQIIFEGVLEDKKIFREKISEQETN